MTNEEAIDILTEVKYFDDSMYQYNSKYMEALDKAIEALRTSENYTRKELEDWLYQIAFNNIDTEFGDSCIEIINRLDGFKRYVTDMRGGRQ